MKALDLFCGLGGWSDGLALEGFEVLGVEINKDIANLYRHPVICEDVKNLVPGNFKDYDLIVGSPPCRDFTKLTSWGHRWKDPPDPKRGLKLVKVFLKFVEEAKPKFWLMENVSRLEKYVALRPRSRPRLGPGVYRCFWGNFPAFLVSQDLNKSAQVEGENRSWERSRIPLIVARSLGASVRTALTLKSER